MSSLLARVNSAIMKKKAERNGKVNELIESRSMNCSFKHIKSVVQVPAFNALKLLSKNYLL